jgi:hypothetical protein
MRVLLVCLLFFISCQDNTEHNQTQKQSETPGLSEEEVPGISNMATATVTEQGQSRDTLEVSSTEYPLDVIDSMEYPYPREEGKVKLLQTGGTFHYEEAWKTVNTENWFGVFINRDSSYLAATKVKARRVRDEMVDDEGEKSGWMVSTRNKDTCMILIHALPYFTDHKIEQLKLRRTRIVPGDTIAFTHQEVSYKLFASGTKRGEHRVPGSYVFINYRLYLSSSKDGKYITEMLAARGVLNDFYVPEIIFAGDIDGDDRPDLLIRIFWFNVTGTYLFLSKPAGDGRLLIPVGRHTTSGC